MPEKAPKKLTREEMNAVSERLSTVRAKSVQLPMLVKRKVLDNNTLYTSIDRLYTAAIEHRKKKLKELESKFYSIYEKPNKISSTELCHITNRLHTESINNHAEKLEVLKSKVMLTYQENSKAKVGRLSLNIKLTQKEVNDMAYRLYNQSLKKKEENNQMLFNKYIATTGPRQIFLPAEQIASSTERLYTSSN